MIKITTLRPDTCKCEIHYQWDDSLPEDQRVHTPIKEFIDRNGNLRQTELCIHHMTQEMKDLLEVGDTKPKPLTDDSKLEEKHAEILSENTLKNHAIAGLGLTEKEQEEVSWSFDNNRKLEITVPQSKTQKEKDDLQTLIDSKQGAGKVTIK